MNDELNSLLAAICDGRATEHEQARLTEILRNDAEARDEYLCYVDLHSALADEALPSLESNIINYIPNDLAASQSPLKRASYLVPFQIAAVFVVLLGLSIFFLSKPSRNPISQAPIPATTAAVSPAIATLVFAEECEWAGTGAVEGERLSPRRLALKHGTVVVRMDGGAELVMSGPVELELRTVGRARLHGGQIVVRAEDGAEGFKLDTPASEVIDLGTEFAVKVEKTGATEVHCLDGLIECRDIQGASGREFLLAGKAVRFDDAAAKPRTVALNAPRFSELIRQAKPRERRDLMQVYEGFFYEPGRYAPRDITKGKGWAGAWRLRTEPEKGRHGEVDSTTDMHIVHGKLNVAWPVPGGRLGMLEMPKGKTFRVRPMAQPINLNSDAITYFSMMTHEPNHLRGRRRSRPNEGVRVTFRSSNDYWGESLSFGLSSTLQPQIQNGTGYGVRSSLSIPDEQSLLWIGKIVSRLHGEDEVFFRIYGQNDTLDFAEPSEWHAVSRGMEHSAKLDLVLLTSQGASPRVVDELRIGPTWRSVVPIGKLELAKTDIQ